MLDLSNIDIHENFYASCDFRPQTLTDEQLRRLLDLSRKPYQQVEKPGRDGGIQYDFRACPFCGQSEGNPAVWRIAGVPYFKCHRAKSGCSAKTFSDLESLIDRPPLTCIKAADLVARYCAPRQDVVRGLIRRGDVINVIGGPKTRKSFFVMQLALAVANGAEFLGRETIKGKVCLIDNELRGDDLARRLKAMSTAMGLSLEGVDLLPLRGKLADLSTIRETVLGFQSSYSLVVVDALYKTLPKGTDENSNSDMTAMYVLLDETAEKTDSAMAVVHHTSKGSQAGKSVTDMGSGAGAQSRSVDVHLVLRDHESPNTVVLQAVIRAQAPVDPVCLTFRYPIWELAPDKNPVNVAVSKRPQVTLDAFLETIPAEPGHKQQVLAASKAKLRLTKSELLALIQEAEKRGLIETVEPESRRLPHQIRRTEQK
jgi:hypothetical protein